MIVVGGTYSEYCYHPEWDQIFGSGGRGAATLTRLGVKNVTLRTCAPKSELQAIEATLSPYGVQVEAATSQTLYEFIYTHPLSEPYLRPYPPSPVTFNSKVTGDVVLAYGMLEGLPRITAKRIVFDPQSEADPKQFFKSIKAKEQLALVLNESELRAFSKELDVVSASKKLINKNGVAVVVVKRGPYGCMVIDASGSRAVPVFPTNNVFKIGSGDVFSAAFCKFWALDNQSPAIAAKNASRCSAMYCSTKSLDAVRYFAESDIEPLKKRKIPSIYLAGPFFSLGQRILVEEARRSLTSLGAKVFSPLHEVGTDETPTTIAAEDLRGLRESTAVLALISDLDPGTIFEIGFARAKKIPVVAYGEGIKNEHLTMLVGSDCICSDDFSSALYNAVWAGMK